MSKRKKGASAPRAAKPAVQRPAAPDAPVASPPNARKPLAPIIFGGVAVAVLIGGVIAWRGMQSGAIATAGAAVTVGTDTPPPTRDPAAKQWPQGGAGRCAASPKFVTQFGFDPQRAAMSTSERTLRGLALVEIGPNGDTSRKGRVFQHPTWRDGGFLGPIARDGGGNLYVGPVPVISTLYNPAGSQNDLYRVDTNTGVLTRAVSLPPVQASDSTNPFGILGLTLDCDTNSLYVSSVMGSRRTEEVGRIFRIDLATNTIVAQLDAIDAIGLGIFNTPYGKRLYIGHARTSTVRSIALDDAGNFKGALRDEFSLEGLGPRGDDRARRISFAQDQTMQLFGVEFGFNLIAPTEKQETQYRFRYNVTRDRWELLE